MLTVEGLSASYGEARVLREVSIEVPAGQIVTLVGRNGAGKTTLLRCVMGLHRQMSGRISLEGAAGSLERKAPQERARAGLGYVPDDRGIYATLSVEENLMLAPVVGRDPWPLKRIYETFGVLEQRRRFPGTRLSGGEQQILAIARVLRMGADVLLCDEPTEGLSPLLVRQFGDILREVKAHGVTVLLIEQNLHFATTVADRHYLLAEGRVAAPASRPSTRHYPSHPHRESPHSTPAEPDRTHPDRRRHTPSPTYQHVPPAQTTKPRSRVTTNCGSRGTWRGCFAELGLERLVDRPRSGWPRQFTPRAGRRGQVAGVSTPGCGRCAVVTVVGPRNWPATWWPGGLAEEISAATVRRWLAADAIKPWQYRSWLFPRDPDFAAKAGRSLTCMKAAGGQAAG